MAWYALGTENGEKRKVQDTHNADIEWFQIYISSVRWKQAKSEKFKHSYTVREWHPDTFERAVKIIRKYGVPERFYKQTYVYLYIDGLKYWTMGAPLEKTIIINCAAADTHYGNGNAAQQV